MTRRGGFNLYGYSLGDPVSLIDPSGLIGIGVYGGAQGEAWFFSGVGAQFDSGAGVFYTPAGGFSTGAFTGAGVFAGDPFVGDGYPAGGMTA